MNLRFWVSIFVIFAWPVFAEPSGDEDECLFGCGGNLYEGVFVENPDQDETDRPTWVSDRIVRRFYANAHIMMRERYSGTFPVVRFWRHLDETDRELCPRCREGGNYYVKDQRQIWLNDDAEMRDMIHYIIMVIQLDTGRIQPDQIHSSFARSERDFFTDVMPTPRPSTLTNPESTIEP